ncbi:hypothetical protein C8R41DRAFT_263916 [Lentinula lateritia]|uniref:Zn(2)-C6 fungal-type domain-containing protein n=1 Tax=Lentinula lateritia TaxID=40482 RepID=A0ABQ8VJJ7_9AGAR|nr:hypothetical protein C8R41DRAFT_263916 [Lentinula lateritia]
MSFVNPPKRFYDDFTDMPHLRSYSHNDPDVRFVNRNQSSYTGYGQNYDEQNPLHLPHAGTNSKTHNLYPSEFYHEALPSSTLHHPNVNEPWVSYPQNYHVDSIENHRFPDYPYPSHHLLLPVAPAASRSNFPNAASVDLDIYSGTHRTLAGSLNPSTGVFYRTPEHPRLRTAQACEKCRTRKAKCSGEHPSCKRCSNRGLVCEYAKEGRVRGPNKPKPKLPVVKEMTSPLVLHNQSSLTSEIPIPISSPVGVCPTRRYVSPSILPPSMSASLSSPSSPCSIGCDALYSPISSSTSSPDPTVGSHCYADPNSSSAIRGDTRRLSNLRLSSGGYDSDSVASNLPSACFQSMGPTVGYRPYSRASELLVQPHINAEQTISTSGAFALDHVGDSAREISDIGDVSLAGYSQTDVTCVPYYTHVSQDSVFAEAGVQRPDHTVSCLTWTAAQRRVCS